MRVLVAQFYIATPFFPLRRSMPLAAMPRIEKRLVQQTRSVHKDMDIQDFDNAEQAVGGAGMVVAATNSKVSVCKGEWIEKGMHLTGVLPNEFDLQCCEKADYIVIFNRLHGRVTTP
jgi:ornithine cyclodeaminase/alanine dehydrogenase-like protein (mu-crystallin family)